MTASASVSTSSEGSINRLTSPSSKPAIAGSAHGDLIVTVLRLHR